MEGPTDFLKKKYDLHNRPEVIQAAKRFEIRTGDRIPRTPFSLIENYLNRFEEIANREDPKEKNRGVEALKKVLNNKYVIKLDEIPESYFDLQTQILAERGQGGDWEDLSHQARKNVLNENAKTVILDQKNSLDDWIDYFASNDAPYPTWLKYYVTRSILGLASYDKERHVFPKRSKGTIKPFPEINREALSYVLDVLEKKYSEKNIDLSQFEEKDRVQFQNLLKGENFGKLYAWAIDKVVPVTVDKLAVTEGRWIKYLKGSEPKELTESLQGHGTGWCTAGESTAATQLRGGDFYVYYSLDQSGNPTVPRVAIRMEGDKIAEVRGVADEQNLDPYIGDVVQKKLQEFPDGKPYEKKASDMKILTEIDNKVKKHKDLTKDDLVFLYEINSKIEYFGHKKDPRIQRLQSERDIKKDAPVVLGCQPGEIAWNESEINKDTKAYIGPLFTNIFKRLDQTKDIYTSFPAEKIRFEDVVIGGKTVEEYEEKFKGRGIIIGRNGHQIIESDNFVMSDNEKALKLVILKIEDLGKEWPNTLDVISSASNFGLEICPAEVGFALRGKYLDQPMDEELYIAMERSVGTKFFRAEYEKYIFTVARDDRGLWLDGDSTKPGGSWFPRDKIVFVVRD